MREVEQTAGIGNITQYIGLCLSSFCILLLLSVKPLLEGEQSAVREAEVMLHCAASTDTLPLRG